MIVSYELATGQVVAIYSGKTSSKAWDQQGCLSASVPPHLESQLTRDHTVEVTNGAVVSITPRGNPVQPAASSSEIAAQSRLARIQEILAMGRSSWTTSQLRELTELLANGFTP